MVLVIDKDAYGSAATEEASGGLQSTDQLYVQAVVETTTNLLSLFCVIRIVRLGHTV